MRWQYSRWDGSQVGLELDADDIMAEITDDLLYHGDLHAALRRMMQSGFEREGQRFAGVRELLDRLRRRRREELERYDLGGVYQELSEELDQIVGQERAALDAMEDSARGHDDRSAELASASAAEHRLALDLAPGDLAGRTRALQSYDFVSPQAERRFSELLERLKAQIASQHFDELSASLGSQSPEELAATREMLDALNQMLEQRARGEDTSEAFSRFMGSYGDLFPGSPGNLDELLEQLAAQMAAMSAMLSSMSAGQRAQLRSLAEQLLADMDLGWQVDRLRRNLQDAFPAAGWERRYDFSGTDPLSIMEAAGVFSDLADLDALESMLRGASGPGALAEVDLERAGELLGEEASRSLAELSRLARLLEDAGLIEQREGRLELTPRGMRKIGQNALSELFSKLARDRLGRHQADLAGTGNERADDTKPYELGDPFHLHIERTLRNALARSGGGTPVSLAPEDFEVERTEHQTRSATVLMIDLSLSMPMRDNFLAAKKVAMALHSLISSQFPRDYLGLVGFSEVARELRAEQLPEVSWDFVYGTNIQHALALSRRMLSTQHGTRQIIMITDGEPTAHVMDDGEVFFSYPPVPETVQATLREVARATREGIRINTFMLDATGYLRSFVEQLTKLNRGRAFFTTPETLGDYVLVDFIEQKRAASRRARGA
ncbi:MAG: hypothetical protein ACRDYD_09090 [Acidimicrobiales bacterium]